MSQPLPPEPEETRPRGGFGAPIRKETEAKPEWRPRQGSPGIWENDAGQVKTSLPLPKFDLQEAMRIWAESHNKDTEQDFLP